MQQLVIHNSWALGDTVCLSALARDIQKAYPGQYRVVMTGHYANVFWINNPHVATDTGRIAGRIVELEYRSGIAEAGKGSKRHFLSWFHQSFKNACGLTIPVTAPRGDIHLTPQERVAKVPGQYWVVVAGGKWDMTAKVWAYTAWQKTIDSLAAVGIRCVQAGGDFQRHFQPTLQNVHSMVGKTRNERDFFSLIANAEGVICGVTAAMHIAAAFEKPCVVIAGGREEPWWEGYTNDYAPDSFGPTCPPVRVPHRYLHTVGKLDCGIADNLTRGCWRSRTVPLEPADHTNHKAKSRLCVRPIHLIDQSVPECLAMISPEEVVAAVRSYYADGTLTPLAAPTTFLPAPTAPELQTPLPVMLPPENPDRPDAPALDHPYIGGKLTLFVLGFGDHLDILERCLNSIRDTCPPHRIDLRVALNQPSPRVRAFVHGFEGITTTYEDFTDRRKYPAMREMFHDPKQPITTNYLCWFDDDSWCRDKKWLTKLAETIVANHANGGRLYGAKYTYDLMKTPPGDRTAWFRAGPWWRGLNLHADGGKRTSPNGSEIVFASGGFWALDVSVMRAAGIPDARLSHNGGDVTIGLQVTQAGYRTVDFSPRPNKAIIAWSDSPRRGVTERFPWLPPA